MKEGSGAIGEFCQQACLECADRGMNCKLRFSCSKTRAMALYLDLKNYIIHRQVQAISTCAIHRHISISMINVDLLTQAKLLFTRSSICKMYDSKDDERKYDILYICIRNTHSQFSARVAQYLVLLLEYYYYSVVLSVRNVHGTGTSRHTCSTFNIYCMCIRRQYR